MPHDDFTGGSAGVPPAVAGASRPRFGEVTIRDRGRLPHWEKPSGLYFVTFRLADSLPQSVRQQIAERQRLLAAARRSGRKLLPAEKAAMAQLSTRRIEQYLDAGHGACALKNDQIASLVANAIQYWDEKRYRLFAWCVMPNHVHVVFRALAGYGLASIVANWKSYTAKEANRILGSEGAFWEREYYDRLLRDGNEFERAVQYVKSNPERAGLRGWRWVWCAGAGRPRDSRRDGGATP